MISKILQNFYTPLFLFTLAMVNYLPFDGLFPAYVKPNILIPCIFFFSIFPQTKPSLTFLIFLGLFEDLLSNSIVGLTPLVYVLTQLIASSNQKALAEQKFFIVWLALIVVLILSSVIKMYFFKTYYQIGGVYYQASISVYFSILIYPSIHYILSKNIKFFGVRN